MRCEKTKPSYKMCIKIKMNGDFVGYLVKIQQFLITQVIIT